MHADTLDTWMFSTEVHMESYLVKPVTKSAGGSNMCLHPHEHLVQMLLR